MMIDPVKVGSVEVNPYVLLYSAFVTGTVMRLLLRAGNAFRSQVNIYPSRWAFISRNWDIFAVRSGVTLVLFSVWVFDPGLLSKGLLGLGIAAGIANWITIPPTLGSSWAGGLFGDWGLDQVQVRIAAKWPSANKYLKGEIPVYDSAVVAVEKLAPERPVGV